MQYGGELSWIPPLRTLPQKVLDAVLIGVPIVPTRIQKSVPTGVGVRLLRITFLFIVISIVWFPGWVMPMKACLAPFSIKFASQYQQRKPKEALLR